MNELHRTSVLVGVVVVGGVVVCCEMHMHACSMPPPSLQSNAPRWWWWCCCFPSDRLLRPVVVDMVPFAVKHALARRRER
jgi:hypothetical protein